MTTLEQQMNEMIRALIPAATALGLVAWAGQPVAAQISVSPVILEIPVAAEAVNRTISVTNAGQAPVSVRFYAGDFDQAESGDNRFAKLDTFPNSCREGIRVYPDGASLLPGETQSVRVDMEPQAGSCWSAVFVETAGMTVDGTMVRQRIAAKVYGIRPGADVEGEVTGVALESSAEGRSLMLTFRNTGEAPLRPRGVIEVRSFAGEVTAKTSVEPFSVLPGRSRTVELLLPPVAMAGEYIAVPVLDFGGAYMAGGQVAFEVAPGEMLYAAGTPAVDTSDDR